MKQHEEIERQRGAESVDAYNIHVKKVHGSQRASQSESIVVVAMIGM